MCHLNGGLMDIVKRYRERMTRSEAVVANRADLFNCWHGRARPGEVIKRWKLFSIVVASAAISLPASAAPATVPSTATAPSTATSSSPSSTNHALAQTETTADAGTPKKAGGPAIPPAISPEEAQIGKEGFKEVEQEYNFVKDAKKLALLQSIVGTLEKGTIYPDIHYVVNIVQDKHPDPANPDINAFSLPGGYIFVTQDLLNFVQSDDELAAVLGHEMAHDVHHHVLRQIRQREHDTLVSLLPILGALLVEGIHPNQTNGEAAANIAMMSQQVVQALQSPHSIHDEHEADISGIEYLYATKKYNPVGMLTFMERLNRLAESRPEFDEGYLQTHPNPPQRVEYIRQKLLSLHIPINPRAVTHALTAEADHVKGSSSALVRMQKIDICTFTDSVGGQDPYARAVAAAKAINDALDRGELAAQLNNSSQGDSAAILWAQRPIFEITANDAAAAHEKPENLAQDAVKRIRQAIWADQVANSSAPLNFAGGVQ